MNRLLKLSLYYYASLLFIAIFEDQIIAAGCWVHERLEALGLA